MHLLENHPLAPLTTLKVGGPARYFAHVQNGDELREALSFATEKGIPFLVLGGGSNMVVSDHGFDGFVLQLVNKGISIESENNESALLHIASGERWDDVVIFAVQNNLWGIENLSHIPGTAGAFPVQNVGAYGAEASQVIQIVEAFDTKNMELRTMTNEECQFRYRKSIFNTEEKGRFIILSITLRLSKTPQPNLKYPDLIQYFQENPTPSLPEIREALITIRNRKFPFPHVARDGSAGSFFKNVITDEQYSQLQNRFDTSFPPKFAEKLRKIIDKFPQAHGVKIPSAFLIEACDLKGLENDGARLNPTQPVVILNKGNATAADVVGLFQNVRRSVYEKTGLVIMNEPELIGFSLEELDEIYRL